MVDRHMRSTADAAAVPPTTESSGLSTVEAQHQLSIIGPNAVAEPRSGMLRSVIAKFWAPVPWMLEAAIVLQLELGQYVEASVIAFLLLFNAALGLAQKSRAQAALTALKSKLALSASVRRDGAWVKLPSEQLVPDDVVKLSLGSVVPADVRVVSGGVLVDQSMLTGESVPVEAGPAAVLYAGGLVRRGEATAKITATGPRTYFGRTAELVRLAHSVSAEQTAIVGLVRNLAVLNGGIVVLMVAYAHTIGMPLSHVIPLVLTAILGSIPVGLPATFTLAAALAAQRLTARGVLPTRLTAVQEIASMDILCSDKTGTLTRNELHVEIVEPLGSWSEDEVLAFAALASSEAGQDPVDAAVREAASRSAVDLGLKLTSFTPFDPSTKRSEAVATERHGKQLRILKGALVAVSSAASARCSTSANDLAAKGYRVLAVGVGDQMGTDVIGLLGLSDPPRADAAPLVDELRSLGVATVMVTGDSPVTASAVAHAVGLHGRAHPGGSITEQADPFAFDVYAGVFPEDKFHLVKAFQERGHTVGMCGDGANDAPALRQAQVGIAVSTATDVAKAAAAIVLTEPGLGGIVDAIKEGRSTFQRILTYALNALIKKIETVLLLAIGLLMTGHAVITPMVMVLLLLTNDFLTMSLTTDRARPSAVPDKWRLDRVMVAAIALGVCKLAFSASALAAGKFLLGLDLGGLQTLAFVVLVFGGQAVVYAIRERRRLCSSKPSGWLLASSAADMTIAGVLSLQGILMEPLTFRVVAGAFIAAVIFGLAVDQVKLLVLRGLAPGRSTPPVAAKACSLSSSR